MSAAGETAVLTVERASRIEWPAVVGGAVIASGISFTLLAFGSAIGLSVMSAASSWRASSPWLWLLSGLFLVFVALCSFGFGGYVAGRMRAPLAHPALKEVEFRDGMHGVLTWGLAILLSAVFVVAGANALSPVVTSGGTAGASASVAGETIIASELDTLFRNDRRLNNADTLAYRRAEAARILLKSSGSPGISSDDRDYLSRITASQTGISGAEAAARTDRVIALATTDIHRARVAGVLQAFLIAAALLLGAAVAWYAACEGGRDREKSTYPSLARRRKGETI